MVAFEEFKTYLEEVCRRNSIGLPGNLPQKLFIYLKELLKWNRVHNLTALRDWRDIILRHFCDSLTVVKLFEFLNYPLGEKSLADVGSGAGFPGAVLSLYYPSAKVCLIESVSKKCSFLSLLRAKLKANYSVHCQMAEDFPSRCNVSVARALEVKGKKVPPLEYADRLLSRIGTDLAVIMKGKEIDPFEVERLGYRVFELDLPDFKGLKILYKFLNGPT